jgi:hypothetical protein
LFGTLLEILIYHKLSYALLTNLIV